MSVAFLFPGQGSQRVGMGRLLAEARPESRAVLDEADAALGFALSRLCFEGPEADLQLTTNTQPALVATSIAALRALECEGLRPDWVAGHSLGEYSALVCAGALNLADAIRTVRLRGQYMQEAVPVGVGAMAAVLGLELTQVEQACVQAADGQVVAPANVNSPGQIVIAGHADAVERASALCRTAGAKRAVTLPVSAPFHCALMRPAQERLAAHLTGVAFREPATPLVSNVDARAVRTAAECRDGLVRQVSAPVLWQQSIELLVAQGVDTFVEVGPGGVLSGLVRRIAKGARTLSVEDPASLAQTVAALTAVGAARSQGN
jgi:[acyl-carrier-protein] S-malonyltransferase